MIRRDGTAYGSNAVRAMHVAGAVDVSKPVAGFYRGKLRGGAVVGGIRIWFGPPYDPVTGEVLDRSWRWMAHFDGQECDFDAVWPVCAGSPITEQMYREFVGRREWAKRNAPDSAFAKPTKRYDPLDNSNPMPF